MLYSFRKANRGPDGWLIPSTPRALSANSSLAFACGGGIFPKTSSWPDYTRSFRKLLDSRTKKWQNVVEGRKANRCFTDTKFSLTKKRPEEFGVLLANRCFLHEQCYTACGSKFSFLGESYRVENHCAARC